MALWNVDLTTQDGAANAASSGGLACMIGAGLGVLSLVFLMASGAFVTLAGLVAVVAEIAVFVVAGLRLRGGKGLFWGSAAAVLLVIEIAFKLFVLAHVLAVPLLIGVMINIVLLIVLINGLRGAAALRNAPNLNDAADVFS